MQRVQQMLYIQKIRESKKSYEFIECLKMKQ